MWYRTWHSYWFSTLSKHLTKQTHCNIKMECKCVHVSILQINWLEMMRCLQLIKRPQNDQFATPDVHKILLTIHTFLFVNFERSLSYSGLSRRRVRPEMCGNRDLKISPLTLLLLDYVREWTKYSSKVVSFRVTGGTHPVIHHFR